ncbi:MULTISPECIES: signal peptidase I [unclassified Streptomyces]|uniref:signal peptidase I n=1 Tax=unclassified Streptomyces TaxID=2593676 RepID=UPI0022597009|nr:signal peptidase I [Streptomyces sp. NBC_00620]MCX4979381.1 signal peptidase I [Streptomyces sp. NBC_00620]WTB38021.1 signal peptidase I [Streptomyces sp. NBC_00827]WUC49145.1 signal peptidase I [Streptomyces sp. NBC_00554]
MGDVAVGARSGHEGPEGRPERPDDSAASAVDAENSESGSADDSAEQESAEQDAKSTKQRSFWKELPILIGIALVLALLIKTFLVQAFSIPSDSMQNTLQQGDRVLVDKLTPWFGSEPERGEVVVFHDPDNWLAGEPVADPNALQTVLSWIGLMPSAEEKDLIKRVVGVGGDTIECKGTGPLTVNGKALNEPYVYPGNTPCSVDEDGGQFKVTVPEGKIWVMGDHRQNSRDSRYNQTDKNHGMVPVDEVVGRAIVKAWPINRWGTLPVPDTFDQSGLNSKAAAAITSPGAAALVGAVPLVLVRRRRKASK